MATPKLPRPRTSHQLSLQTLEPRHLLSAFLFSPSNLTPPKSSSPAPAIQLPSPSLSKLTLNLCPSFIFSGQTILFSQTSTAVQNGLTALASAHTLNAPTASTVVQLGDANGVESYSVFLTAPGISARIAVDLNGNPIIASTRTTLDWTTFSTNDPTAAAGISTLATDLGLNAPSSNTKVLDVTQNAADTYTVTLSAPKGHHPRYSTITVDSSGNPVGTDLELPFNFLSTPIQDGLIANEPTGTTLTSASTQNVFIDTIDGTPTYTMVFGTGHAKTLVSVDQSGNLLTLPSHSSTTLASVSSPALTELQTLATADGYTGTLPSTQPVAVSTTLNNTLTVYTINLTLSNHHHITLSVDSNGNPTVPPLNDTNWPAFFLFHH